MKEIVYISANREGYGIDQVRHTMTVGELIGYLEQFDEDAQVFLKHDGGYTFAGITEWCFEDGELGEDE